MNSLKLWGLEVGMTNNQVNFICFGQSSLCVTFAGIVWSSTPGKRMGMLNSLTKIVISLVFCGQQKPIHEF